MNFFINGLALLAAFAFMEFVAWFMHKYVMHTFLWSLHKDHHKKDHGGFFELNDAFFIVFATPGILLMYFGFQGAEFNDFRFWLGMGITLYGFAYLFVHDVFIHQRIRVLRRTDNVYFQAMRKAHKVHHKHLGKENGESFGFLWVPKRYMNEARQKKTG